MKKVPILLVCVLLAFASFPSIAQADIGPKPSVVIDFIGLEGETYYVTLLSETASTGPYSACDKSARKPTDYQEGYKDYDIYLKFLEYEDTDGFYFLQFFKNCSKTQQFSWTYYPPQRFKILLYFPATDSFIVSEGIHERYAFDSYYTVEIEKSSISSSAEDGALMNVRWTYDFTGEALSLTIRVLLTLAIEMAVALLFGFRGKRLLGFIAIANVITQVLLNVALNLVAFFDGPWGLLLFYVPLEIAVFIIEAVLYYALFKYLSEKQMPGWKPAIYALVANAASFVIGLCLLLFLPAIS